MFESPHRRQAQAAWPLILGPEWGRLVAAYWHVVAAANAELPAVRADGYFDEANQLRLLDLDACLRAELENAVRAVQFAAGRLRFQCPIYSYSDLTFMPGLTTAN